MDRCKYEWAQEARTWSVHHQKAIVKKIHMQTNNFNGFHPCRTVSHREKYQGVLTFLCPCCRLQCSTLVRTVTGFYNFHALWIPERYEYHVLHTFMWEASVIRYRYGWRTSLPSRLCKFLHSIEKHFSIKPHFKWRNDFLRFGSCLPALYLQSVSYTDILVSPSDKRRTLEPKIC